MTPHAESYLSTLQTGPDARTPHVVPCKRELRLATVCGVADVLARGPSNARRSGGLHSSRRALQADPGTCAAHPALKSRRVAARDRCQWRIQLLFQPIERMLPLTDFPDPQRQRSVSASATGIAGLVTVWRF